ncbi:MAG: DUF3144 domain-containing protein [Candidatus Thiodiazotropha sp. (ex Ctena orbiculata)]|nr:DUF3144 domain-containing protein [Candidatus Thiodiazotropha taylori]MBT3036748.1 DUF3144 domain-containing protein [Candidatus Thiodiazotropha taylori]MBV2136131.1 DUF3144 domain-containing protein [Candidatus Thiodiazotropha taylori]
MQVSDFREVADQFILLANELGEEWATPFLDAAFFYAAAWYNTHQDYASVGVSENRLKAVEYCCDHNCKKLLECKHDFSNA